MGLYYEEYGKKGAPIIVFIHGGGVSSWMWSKQVQHFSQYHCITIDLPEQGKNTESEMFSIKSSAQKITELLKKIANKKKTIVIGFSLGAQVIMQMLSNNQKLIDYAIINSALVRPSFTMAKMIRPTIMLTYPLIKIKAFAQLQAKTLYINNDFFEDYYNESTAMERNTLIRILEENMSFTIPKDFNNATCEILVTVGEKEKSIMKKSARDIVFANPNSTGIIIPGVGHGAPLAKPTYFNKMIEQWLNSGTLPQDAQLIK